MDDRAGIDGASEHGATSLAYRGAGAPGLGRLGWAFRGGLPGPGHL